MSDQTGERHEALKLNILILLGMQDAVSLDKAMRIGDVLSTASDPESTDGAAYSEEEVFAAISSLIEEEMVRHAKGEFDSSNLYDYATSFHPDHTLYITPPGILFVKRLIDRGDSPHNPQS